ncbi:MAG: hypothetical protein CL466_06690 [Acidimicrobiaceae bacterium]|nr:hypothetical protein [Acidimicrobiaceae bacterium]
MSAARSRGGLGPTNVAAAPRAFLLIGVAIVIGLVLLWKGLDTSPSGQAPAPSALAPTTEAPDPGDAGTGAGSSSGSTDTTPTIAATTPTTVVPTTTAPPMPEPTHAPNEVKVLVANGSGVSGAAGKVTDMLSPLGWAMESPANADKTSISGIYYKAGYARDARVIQEHFGEDPNILQQIPTGGLAVPANAEERVANADIIIILGSDLAIQGG